jgi:uncharacterized membrane protein
MNLPPVHPALVHLPIAFVTLSFIADLFARIRKSDSLRQVGFWALVAGLIGGVITIAAGYFDFNRASLNHETSAYVWLHLKIGWTLAAGLILLTFWRWRIRQRAMLPSGAYLLVMFLGFALTMFQGWYGGEMVYSHGAGVAAAGQGTEPTNEAQARLAHVKSLLEPNKTEMGAPGQGVESGRGTGHK